MLKEHWFEIYLLGAFIFMAWNPLDISDKLIAIRAAVLWPIYGTIHLFLWAWQDHRIAFKFIIAGIFGMAIILSVGCYFIDKEQEARDQLIIKQTLDEVKRQCDAPPIVKGKKKPPLRLDDHGYTCERIGK